MTEPRVSIRLRLPRRLAGIAMLIYVLSMHGPGATEPQQIFETHETAETLALPDGTILRAAPHTRAEIQLHSRGRSIHLPRGNMFFNVAHDANRPFVVHTPVATVHALGTRFGVSIREQESLVSLLDGSVAVSGLPSQNAEPQSDRAWTRKLMSSEQLRVTSQGPDDVPQPNVARALAWATKINFYDDPLIMAVEQFSRRSGAHVELQDPNSLRMRRLTGDFNLDDPEGFATYVAESVSTTVLLHRPGPVVQTITPKLAQPSK